MKFLIHTRYRYIINRFATNLVITIFLIFNSNLALSEESFGFNGKEFWFDPISQYCNPDSYPSIKTSFEAINRSAKDAGYPENVVHMMFCAAPHDTGKNLVFPTMWIRPFSGKIGGGSDKVLQKQIIKDLKKGVSELSKNRADELIAKISDGFALETGILVGINGKPYIYSSDPFTVGMIVSYSSNNEELYFLSLYQIRVVKNELFFVYVNKPLGEFGFEDINFEKNLELISKSIR